MILEDGGFGDLAPRVRPAAELDLPRIAAWMAPHLATGVLRPRALRAEDFLVSQRGCVALSAWSATDLELGSLVSAQPGHGRALVEAALAKAWEMGAERVLCLTGAPGFFERLGFVRVGSGQPPHRQPNPCGGVAWKAARCALCPDAGHCTQVLMEVRP